MERAGVHAALIGERVGRAMLACETGAEPIRPGPPEETALGMIRFLGRIARDTRVLVALHAALLVAIGILWAQGQYEDRVFRRLVDVSTSPEMSDQETTLALLHAVHEAMDSRNEVWGEKVDRHQSTGLFENALDVLLIEGGQCGDYSMVLARALKTAGLEARFSQMKVRGLWSGHILAEAKIDGRWVVLDPLFDLAFFKDNGDLASAEELHRDWSIYEAQLPDHYDRDASYREVRRTNWQKIPVVMPAIRSVAEGIYGSEAVEGFSLRSHILNVYKTYAILLSIVYLGVIGLTIVAVRSRARSQPA